MSEGTANVPEGQQRGKGGENNENPDTFRRDFLAVLAVPLTLNSACGSST